MQPDQCWEAVATRDAVCDGSFVYGVRSTGVYCRPSCPSRRPLRRNVEFFDGPDEAEAGGFRACRRCTPRAPAPPTPTAEAVAAACRVLDGAVGPVALADLGRAVGLSPWHLQRSFTRLVGVTPREYGAAARLGRSKDLLRAGAGVAGAAYGAGYGSSRGFYEDAADGLGMQPATYRRGGAGESIAWTVVGSRLGPLLVAATGRGVCAVRFVGGDDEGEAAVRLEFPAAERRRDDGALGDASRRVVAAVDGDDEPLDLPLDVRATAFQLRVWEALRAIPRGQTRSYSEVAAAIGSPRAVRAVAGACAANPVAVVVPCHRVVASDGSLAGYRWGVDRKEALLAAEGASPGTVGSRPERSSHETGHVGAGYAED